jgi:hypothetical protein
MASSRGYDRLSPTPSMLVRCSSSTLAASSRGHGRVSLTLSTSARRSTPTLVASSRGSARVLPTSSTSAHRSPSTPLVASVWVDDHSSPARDCTSTSSAVTLSVHEIVQLRCLLDAWDSSSTGSAGSMTDFSGIERPPYPSPRTSPWLLDTGASFYMTHNSFLLNSVRPVDSPVHVLTADGTPS